MRLIFDAHLDLAWCAVSFNRDLTLTVDAIRAREKGMTDEPSRGFNTLSLPELRSAGVAVCVATLLARSGPAQAFKESYKRTDLDHSSPSIAYAVAHGQLTYYRLLEQQGHIRILLTRGDLQSHWKEYAAAPKQTPMGVILSMEGADAILHPEQAQEWFDVGLRACGPAHYGRGQYAFGTAVDGPLGARGVELLKAFERTGIILDATHLSDTSFWEAMNVYQGPVLASHHNCRALVPGDRQLADEQIKALVNRGAVIGAAFDAWMLFPGWIRGQTKSDVVGLSAVADHMDHICQLAGNSDHAALGTDLDGGFGYEQTPRELNRFSDMEKLGQILADRGYGDEQIDGIFHGNWLRFFLKNLPE